MPLTTNNKENKKMQFLKMVCLLNKIEIHILQNKYKLYYVFLLCICFY